METEDNLAVLWPGPPCALNISPGRVFLVVNIGLVQPWARSSETVKGTPGFQLWAPHPEPKEWEADCWLGVQGLPYLRLGLGRSLGLPKLVITLANDTKCSGWPEAKGITLCALSQRFLFIHSTNISEALLFRLLY